LHTSVFVQGAGELVDGGGNLQTLLEDRALTLETDIERPLNVTGQVTLRLDVVTDGEVTGALLEKRVGSDSLRLLSLGGEGSGSNLLRSL